MPEVVIPSFRTEFSEAEIAESIAATEHILRAGQLTLGLYTEKFEGAMAGVSQTAHAIAVNSGSTALEVAYRLLKVRDRKVLIPTNTNFATAAAAVYAGAEVQFYDSGLYPSIDSLSAQLTEDTAALVVVHIGGYITPDMERIVVQARELGVPLIEDCAHAHGASLAGQAAGSFGEIAAFSFFPTKTLTTGEGGMITTNNTELAIKARQYRDQGKHSDGVTHEVWGNSWRMTEIGAALGLAQIKNVERDNQRRAAIINRYQTELADTVLEFPIQSSELLPAGYKCIAILPEGIAREGLRQTLKARGIMLGKEVYEKPLHQQPVFGECVTDEHYPIANHFAARHICLPLWRFIEDEEVATVIKHLRAVLL